MLVGTGTLVFSYELSYMLPDMPGYCQDVIVVSAGTAAAIIFEVITGTVSIISVEAVILCMAPGGSALLNAVAKVQSHYGNPLASPSVLSVFFDLIAKGSSLGMGVYLANEFMRPLIVTMRQWKMPNMAREATGKVLPSPVP